MMVRSRISFSSFFVGRARARRVAASRTYLAMSTGRPLAIPSKALNCPASILSEVMPFQPRWGDGHSRLYSYKYLRRLALINTKS